MDKLIRFLKDEEGVTALEYGLIASDIDETLLRVEVPVPGERFEEGEYYHADLIGEPIALALPQQLLRFKCPAVLDKPPERPVRPFMIIA